MGTFTIYHSNAIINATLSGGAWDASLSLEKLRDYRPKLKARSANAMPASTLFNVVLPAPQPMIGVQLVSTNISNAGRYKLTWFQEAEFITNLGTTGWVDAGESIDWLNTDEWFEWEDPNFWLGTEEFVDPDNQGRDIRIRLAELTPLQFIRVEIDDESNPDGYVEIGHAYFGRPLTPSFNVSPNDSGFSRVSNTSIQKSAGQTRYTGRVTSTKRLMAVWPALPMSEVLGEIDDVVLIHDVDVPVYVDLDPEDASAVGQKTAFLATIERLPEYKLLNVFFDDDIGASAAFEFMQVH